MWCQLTSTEVAGLTEIEDDPPHRTRGSKFGCRTAAGFRVPSTSGLRRCCGTVPSSEFSAAAVRVSRAGVVTHRSEGGHQFLAQELRRSFGAAQFSNIGVPQSMDQAAPHGAGRWVPWVKGASHARLYGAAGDPLAIALRG